MRKCKNLPTNTKKMLTPKFSEASGRWGMHERYIGYEEKAGWNGHQERYNSLRDGERKYRSFAKNHENLSR